MRGENSKSMRGEVGPADKEKTIYICVYANLANFFSMNAKEKIYLKKNVNRMQTTFHRSARLIRRCSPKGWRLRCQLCVDLRLYLFLPFHERFTLRTLVIWYEKFSLDIVINIQRRGTPEWRGIIGNIEKNEMVCTWK